MKQNEIDEILDHINTKVAEDVPSLVKMIVRKKMGVFNHLMLNLCLIL